MLRTRLCRTLLLSLVAGALLGFSAPVAAQEASEPTLRFVGGGWGHGVGMSQYGALGRAEAGHTAEEILTHYYDGTTVEDRSETITTIVGDEVEADTAAGEGIRVRLGQGRPDAIRVSVTRSTEARSTEPDETEPDETEPDGTEPDGTEPDGTEPDGTEPARGLVVTIGDQTFNADSTIVLQQGCQTDANGDCASQSGEAQAETWKWILKIDEGGDSCVGCVAATPVITWPDNTVVTVGEWDPANNSVTRNLGEHDTGALHFRSRDVFFDPNADDGAFVVLHVPLRDYLQALAEMPSSWHPIALQAQAIAGRSYAVHRAIDRENLAFDVFDSVQDQVYGGYNAKQGGRIDAANDTVGTVVAVDDLIVQTFYSSSNGGHSESTENSMSFGAAEPWHIAKPDPFDAAPDEDGEPQNPFAQREFEFTVSEISRWLNEYSSADLGVGTVRQIIVDELPPSNRITNALVTIIGTQRTLEVRGVNGDGGSNPDGPPFGLRFQAAIQRGCEAEYGTLSSNCPLSSNFSPVGFVDVASDDFFYEPVNWMAHEEITTGTSPGFFSPRDAVTRAQAATFIWRFAGEPAPEAPSGFDDVADDVYFTDAVAWMKERGITTGTSRTEFSPDGVVTRAQLATFLWRLAGEPPVEPSDQFEDVQLERFYTDPVAWMVQFDITTGTSPTTFDPDADVTRGQLATFLWRVAGKPEAFAESATLPEKMRS